MSGGLKARLTTPDQLSAVHEVTDLPCKMQLSVVPGCSARTGQHLSQLHHFSTQAITMRDPALRLLDLDMPIQGLAECVLLGFKWFADC